MYRRRLWFPRELVIGGTPILDACGIRERNRNYYFDIVIQNRI